MSVKLIKGKFTIVGKQPDGDSVRFVPDRPALFEDLYRYHRMRFNQNDGSIQLRLEGIDTPETHYGPNYSQPLGKIATEGLLKALGFKGVAWKGASVSRGEDVPGVILTSGADANGRPISYVFSEGAEPALAEVEDGANVSVTPAIVKASVNMQQIKTGAAYLTLYTSMPKNLRHAFREQAAHAKTAKLGVWAVDSSAEFWLERTEDVAADDGQLILPKLFRRAIDYCKSEFDGGFIEWIHSRSGGYRPENDGILLEASRVTTTLAGLLEDVNGYIRLNHDILDMVFEEK